MDIVAPEFRLDERRFGVEIEFLGTRSRVVAAMRRHGLSCESESYNHYTQQYWKVVPDGSLSDGGGELVSPPLNGNEGRRLVAIASQALIETGATLDTSTGLHVHHEVRDLDAETIVRAVRGYVASQEAIDWLVSRSRRSARGASYCHPLTVSELEQLNGVTSTPSLERACAYFHRYRVVNLTSFPNYGTLEFRQHGGTIEAEKILAWIAFGQSMIAASAAGVDLASQTPDDLLAVLAEHGNLDSGAVEFLRERARRFRVREEERQTAAATARSTRARPQPEASTPYVAGWEPVSYGTYRTYGSVYQTGDPFRVRFE